MSRHNRKCSLCSSVVDQDVFITIGNYFLCRECRTCKCGVVHYENGYVDVCYRCVRALFTSSTLWGDFIYDLQAYKDFGHRHGLHPLNLETWHHSETSRLWELRRNGTNPNPDVLPYLLKRSR